MYANDSQVKWLDEKIKKIEGKFWGTTIICGGFFIQTIMHVYVENTKNLSFVKF